MMGRTRIRVFDSGSLLCSSAQIYFLRGAFKGEIFALGTFLAKNIPCILLAEYLLLTKKIPSVMKWGLFYRRLIMARAKHLAE